MFTLRPRLFFSFLLFFFSFLVNFHFHFITLLLLIFEDASDADGFLFGFSSSVYSILFDPPLPSITATFAPTLNQPSIDWHSTPTSSLSADLQLFFSCGCQLPNSLSIGHYCPLLLFSRPPFSSVPDILTISLFFFTPPCRLDARSFIAPWMKRLWPPILARSRNGPPTGLSTSLFLFTVSAS